MAYNNSDKYNSNTLNIYGYHSVYQIIKYRTNLLIKIYLQSDSKYKDKILNLLPDNKNISFLDKKKLDFLSDNNKHQGVVALIKKNTLTENNLKNYINNLAEDKNYTILILEKIQDPRNLGACLRSAGSFDVDAVIITKNNTSPINSLVFKASSGYASLLDIFVVSNLGRVLDILAKKNIWLFGLSAKVKQNISEINLPKNIAIILGSENGISLNVQKKCDELVRIENNNNVESLNLSVACAIALYSIYIRK